MALLQGAAPGTDIVFTEERVVSARAFANKIWNAARFLFMKMERAGVEGWVPTTIAITKDADARRPLDLQPAAALRRAGEPRARNVSLPRSRADLVGVLLARVLRLVRGAQEAALREGSGLTDDWRNLLTVFEAALRLLHPVMPFLTEELWQRLTEGAPGRVASIALAEYPVVPESVDDSAAEEEMRLLQEIVTAARNLRAENKIDPKQKAGVVLSTRDAALRAARAHREAIEALARIDLDVREAPPEAPAFQIRLDVAPAQIEAQRQRLEREIEQLEKVIANSERQLTNEAFMSRAPAAVVESMRAKLEEYRTQLANKRAALGDLAAS